MKRHWGRQATAGASSARARAGACAASAAAAARAAEQRVQAGLCTSGEVAVASSSSFRYSTSQISTGFSSTTCSSGVRGRQRRCRGRQSGSDAGRRCRWSAARTFWERQLPCPPNLPIFPAVGRLQGRLTSRILKRCRPTLLTSRRPAGGGGGGGQWALSLGRRAALARAPVARHSQALATRCPAAGGAGTPGACAHRPPGLRGL